MRTAIKKFAVCFAVGAACAGALVAALVATVATLTTLEGLIARFIPYDGLSIGLTLWIVMTLVATVGLLTLKER